MLIPTKYCTTIQTTKYFSLVVQRRLQQIQDGRYLENGKITISPLVLCYTFKSGNCPFKHYSA